MLLTDNEVLINAAKKTIGMFDVAACNVSGIKKKRIYNDEDMTDLDIKTSKNLIGEVINTSQCINTLIWDTLSKGGKYGDVDGMYLDVCKLSILSMLEIDKAKKEFIIDSYRELSAIKSKYKFTKDDKTVKPWFFAHIVKQKGFYNPRTKAYVKFKTSMDYLQEAINSYKKVKHRRPDYSYAAFSDIIKDKNFRNDFVDHQKIVDVYDHVVLMKNRISEVYANAESPSNAYNECIPYKCEFIEYLHNLNMNKSTMVALLQSVEAKSNSNYRMIFFYALFQRPHTSLFNYIRESHEHIPILIEDEYGRIDVYGTRFREI